MQQWEKRHVMMHLARFMKVISHHRSKIRRFPYVRSARTQNRPVKRTLARPAAVANRTLDDIGMRRPVLGRLVVVPVHSIDENTTTGSNEIGASIAQSRAARPGS